MDHRCFLRACLRLTAAESAEASGFIVKWLFLRLFVGVTMMCDR